MYIYIMSVTVIDDYAFQGTGLTSITLPNTVTSIGNFAYNNCSLLTYAYLGSNISSIGNSAFLGCTSLSTVYIMSYVAPTLGTNAFTPYVTNNTLYLYPGLSTSPYTSYFNKFVYNWPIMCFLENTKILTDKGYMPVQDLRKGDLIQTLRNGFVPLNMIGKKEINNLALNERIKDQLYVFPKNEEVFEDLVMTGCHAILIDEFKEGDREKTQDLLGDIYITDNKYRLPACIDERTQVYQNRGPHMIYHFALDNDDYYMNFGVYANGLLVETGSQRYLKELSDMTLF